MWGKQSITAFVLGCVSLFPTKEKDVFPFIPVISAIAVALGLSGYFWYDHLSSEDKKKADKLAADYSWRLFKRSLDSLTQNEFSRVLEQVKKHF